MSRTARHGWCELQRFMLRVLDRYPHRSGWVYLLAVCITIFSLANVVFTRLVRASRWTGGCLSGTGRRARWRSRSPSPSPSRARSSPPSQRGTGPRQKFKLMTLLLNNWFWICLCYVVLCWRIHNSDSLFPFHCTALSVSYVVSCCLYEH